MENYRKIFSKVNSWKAGTYKIKDYKETLKDEITTM